MIADFRYHALIDRDLHQQAREWCEQCFAQPFSVIDHRAGRWMAMWAGREHYSKYRYSFTKEEDYVWFRLRFL